MPNDGDYCKFWDDDKSDYSIGILDRVKPPSSTNAKEFRMVGQLPEGKGFKNAEKLTKCTK